LTDEVAPKKGAGFRGLEQQDNDGFSFWRGTVGLTFRW
jgi:hypothetical protein